MIYFFVNSKDRFTKEYGKINKGDVFITVPGFFDKHQIKKGDEVKEYLFVGGGLDYYSEKLLHEEYHIALSICRLSNPERHPTKSDLIKYSLGDAYYGVEARINEEDCNV